MTITVRLDEELERNLEVLAMQEGLSKSALIRQCLEHFIQMKSAEKTAWDLGKQFFGKHSSGKGDLSTKRKQIVREKVHAKKSNH